MAHGQADFGMYAAKETVGSLSDMGELAARLGSIVTLDRRGDVILLEDFEAPILSWTGVGDGDDDVQRLYPGKAFMGSQCLLLLTSTTAGNESYIARRFFATPDQRYGLEARIQFLVTYTYTDLWIDIYTGSKCYEARWRYDNVNFRLLILDSTNNWKEVATGIKAGTTHEEWWPSKLVVDSLTMKYVRGLFLGVEYDLSDESMRRRDSEVPFAIGLGVLVETAANQQQGAFFDNLIITQNEP